MECEIGGYFIMNIVILRLQGYKDKRKEIEGMPAPRDRTMCVTFLPKVRLQAGYIRSGRLREMKLDTATIDQDGDVKKRYSFRLAPHNMNCNHFHSENLCSVIYSFCMESIEQKFENFKKFIAESSAGLDIPVLTKTAFMNSSLDYFLAGVRTHSDKSPAEITDRLLAMINLTRESFSPEVVARFELYVTYFTEVAALISSQTM
jgi:hypothetical protein